MKAFFRKRTSRIGIYGPPNAGKTTLANRIVRDWVGDAGGPVSEIPHETRRVRRKENITITGQNGSSITFDIVDTPGVTTKIDYNEFMEYGLEKEEAIKRARETGFNLEECQELLALYRDEHRTSAQVKKLAQEKIVDLRARIAGL